MKSWEIKHLILLKVQNMADIIWLVRMVYKFFDKTSGSGVNNEIKQNQQLAEELHKTIIRKDKKEEFILHLKTILWVLIWLICN